MVTQSRTERVVGLRKGLDDGSSAGEALDKCAVMEDHMMPSFFDYQESTFLGWEKDRKKFQSFNVCSKLTLLILSYFERQFREKCLHQEDTDKINASFISIRSCIGGCGLVLVNHTCRIRYGLRHNENYLSRRQLAPKDRQDENEKHTDVLCPKFQYIKQSSPRIKLGLE